MPPSFPMGDAELLKGLTALYVEDDVQIRTQLQQYLSRRLGTVLTADNGQLGLEIYRQTQPDLIITDLLMPVMDGLTMIRHLREHDNATPVIVTTAYSDEEYLMRAIEVGVDRYILKPIDPKRLIDGIIKVSRTLWQEREQQRFHQYVQFLLDSSPNLLLVLLPDGQVEFLNKAFLSTLGFTSLEQFQQSEQILADWLLTPEFQPISQCSDGNPWYHYLLGSEQHIPIIYIRCHKQQELARRPYSVTTKHLSEPERFIVSLTDITTIDRQIRELEFKAFTDALTGTCNRARLQTLLYAEMQRSQRHGQPLAVVLLDVDHFKRVNDTFGHQTGDLVLIELSTLVSQNLRASDVLARWGGEEFMVVTPDSDLDAALLLAEKLRKLIEQHDFPCVGRVTSSFGVAQYLVQETISMLTERADQALYHAKRAGRNRVESTPAPAD
ncbi:GGDEF domain-containing response regulator [Candidatus Magnetaquicoccus inordinatus]|uniref:GGDEF domain-containing response regulator n=1 Tax=Candidatus Magnetaquicoccus inordinatus TaxID=2496818 RepID=UPI00102D271B|nr:diguanylate cyclase [Candidatus Magnetaquicoccus inordinatus]